MIYIVAFTIDGEEVLSVNGNGLMGAETLAAAKKFLPDYKRKHTVSFTSSMSATIHFAQYQPKIVQFASLEAVGEVLTDRKQWTCYHIAGSVKYVKTKPDYVPDVAYSPKLV